MKAQVWLAEKYGVAADVWSVTSYKELRREALEVERWNRLHPTQPQKKNYIEKTLENESGLFLAVSDNMKALPEFIQRWVPGGLTTLGSKPGEQLVIGNNIRVTIVSVGPGRVKIGIEAPPDVRIDRQEIHEKILHEQEQATDVLSAVTGAHADGQSPTMSGSATMHLGDAVSPIAVNRVKHRLPRKPR